MSEHPETVGAGGHTETTLEEIPKKLEGFANFIDLMKQVILQGTDKYHGEKKDAWETIDVIPLILGEEGYRLGILFDLIKRIFRIKNQNRERDVIKMAVWLFLYWQRFFRQAQPQEDQRCPSCYGTGNIERLSNPVGGTAIKCGLCHGTGRIGETAEEVAP